MKSHVLPLPRLLLEQLRHTEQNPTFHAEGNVLNHTQAVLNEFLVSESRLRLPESLQEVLYWTAVLHDLGKIKVTTWRNGKWSARGHEAAGCPMARKILQQNPSLSQHQKRQILMLIRWHHLPLRWMVDKNPLLDFKDRRAHV